MLKRIVHDWAEPETLQIRTRITESGHFNPVPRRTTHVAPKAKPVNRTPQSARTSPAAMPRLTSSYPSITVAR
jgi:hypothetical protein